jgi:hypothetical protein
MSGSAFDLGCTVADQPLRCDCRIAGRRHEHESMRQLPTEKILKDRTALEVRP